MRTNHKEDNLEEQISSYLQRRYPKTIFRFDSSASAKKSMFQAVRFKKLHGRWTKGYPDLIILEARNGYHGLFIELKAVTPYKKDGTLKKSEHLERQEAYHSLLMDRGYLAVFGVGFDAVRLIVDTYMSCEVIKGDG